MIATHPIYRGIYISLGATHTFLEQGRDLARAGCEYGAAYCVARLIAIHRIYRALHIISTSAHPPDLFTATTNPKLPPPLARLYIVVAASRIDDLKDRHRPHRSIK